MTSRGDREKEMPQSQTPAKPGPLITRSDPAVQIVDSAYQIVTMIGANPRAIRPILTQRRLTKEQVLEAAARALDRTSAMLAELDAADAERRAQHEATVQRLKDRIDAWQLQTDPAATQREQAPEEIARLQAELEAANAAFDRFQAEQRRPRTFLAGLHDRAVRVQEVYQAL
jgi:chromosome segregation ATPase